MDLGKGAAVADIFLDQQLVVRKSRHLRRVGDAKYLMARGGLVQQLADAPGRQAGNAGVDLVIDDGRQLVAVGQGAFERQHNTGKLAAGGDFGQRLGFLAGVGGDQELNIVLPVGGKRAARMAQGKADARHVEKFKRGLHLFVHGGEGFEAAFGQRFGRCACFLVELLHFGAQLGDGLAGGLDRFQLGGVLVAAGQQFLRFQAKALFQAVDRIQAAFDLVELARVKAVGVETVGQVGCELARAVVQFVQPLRQRRQAFVQPGALLQAACGGSKQISRPGRLPFLITGQRRVRGRDAVQNALGMGDNGAALLQLGFLARLQVDGVDALDLLGQFLHTPLLVGFPGRQRFQAALAVHKFAVQLVIGLVLRRIAGVLVQDAQVVGWVGQALAVVMAVDAQQPG